MKSVVMSWEWWLCHVIRWGPPNKDPEPHGRCRSKLLSGESCQAKPDLFILSTEYKFCHWWISGHGKSMCG